MKCEPENRINEQTAGVQKNLRAGGLDFDNSKDNGEEMRRCCKKVK